MWLFNKLFGPRKPKEKKYREETIWVDVKKKVNVKKAFCTVRLKNGENVLSKEYVGMFKGLWCCGWQVEILTGKECLVTDLCALRADAPVFYHINPDRIVRLTDIMDFIGIVETDHEIEVDTKEKKILREEI